MTAEILPFAPAQEEDPLAKLCATELEQALLGALLIENRLYEHVAELITPEDFGFAVHGRIFGAMAQIITSGGAATPISLASLFSEDPALPNATVYLAQLAGSAVTLINGPHYARQIADLAQRRDIVAAAQETIVDATTIALERSAEVILDEAEERLFQIGEHSSRQETMRPIGEVVRTTIADIEAAYKRGGAVTVDTGLADLDRIVAGLGAGDLVVVAGRPSMGKSALSGTIAFNAARQGKRVLIFSLEMTKAELSQRWLAGLTGISTDAQRHGRIPPDDWQKLITAQDTLAAMPILVDDQARLSVAQMRQRARRVRRRHGLDLMIVDHLQLVRQGGRQESRRLEIGDASSMLKGIAKELGIPVLLLSQLSRGPEQRDDKRPILSDLRESGDIEQDADVVLLLYREEYYLQRSEPRQRPNETREAFTNRQADWDEAFQRAKGLAELSVGKNRHGRTGIARIMFDAGRQRFENLLAGDLYGRDG